MANIKPDAILTLRSTGEKVRVIGKPDSDPRATVWVCYVEAPDTDAHVTRSELEQ